MAEVITRFKLETTQYDSKLRDASNSLAELTHQLSMAGKDFERFSKEHVQTAASLGQVASGATNLKDKLRDLVGAYNTVARAYNSLAKDQQSGEFGKAMAESLQKLQQDITQTKNELYNIGEQSKGTGGIMDQLASKFTLNIDAMKLFNVGLQAAQGALKVAKDAFFNNEQQLDEWGRVVESAESLYKGFLNSLNTGDISGFLSNIDTITQAARDAYDALDELATFNAFNKANIAKARANLTGSIADYREGNGSKEDVSKASADLLKELEMKQKLQRQAYEKVVTEVATQRQVNPQDLLRVMTGKYGTFKELKDLEYTGTRQTVVGMGAFARTATVAAPANDRERLAEAVKHLNDTEIDNFQSLAEAAEMTQVEINNQRKMVARILNGQQGAGGGGGNGGGGGGGGRNVPKPEEIIPSGSVADLTKQMSELRKAQDLATDTAAWTSYEEKINAVLLKIKVLKGELNSSAITFGGSGLANASGVSTNSPMTREDLIAKGNNKITGPGNLSETLTQQAQDAAAKQVASAKAVEESWRNAGNAVGTFGNILGALKDPAAQIGATVAQAIASVALAYADTLAKDKTTKSNIWAFIAASAAAMLSMGTTIAQIHSSTGYASGGVVGGSHYSGDIEYARLNAGETVLTQAQTGIVASALQNSANDLHLETDVRGDTLRLILRRGNMKRGYGSRSLVL